MNGNKTPEDVKAEMRKKEPQAGDASAKRLLRRIESSTAYPTSDPTTGESELGGDAFPQSKTMEGEMLLLRRLAQATGGKGAETKSSTTVGKAPSKASTTTIKHNRSNYAPTGRKAKTTKPGLAAYNRYEQEVKMLTDPQRGLITSDLIRDENINAGMGITFDPDTGLLSNQVSEQGLLIHPTAMNHKLAEDTLGVDDISNIIDQHQKDTMYSDVHEDDISAAALDDLTRDYDNKYEMWSGDGPEGEGRVVFFTNDDDETTGYWLRDGRKPQNVTGMLFPPRFGL